jgi:threonine aldolase
MHEVRIDLYSDTASRPSAEMRQFMCAAEVGDEQKGEDPTTNELQRMTCELLGKEAAVFLPSGSMCNQVAFAAHCRPGDLILMERNAHPLIAEAAGSAVISGAIPYPIDGKNGTFTAEQVREAIWQPSRHRPPFRLVSVEQTTNVGGGRVWPLKQTQEVCQAAHDCGALAHMDGARLLNAVVASGVSAKAFSAPFDSVWLDLSKGLGAPVGGVLAGPRDFIDRAWQWKHRLGGAMRQSGIIAAGGIFALCHNVARLADDHENARLFARLVARSKATTIDPDAVETNIVRFGIEKTGLTALNFIDRLWAETGVRLSPHGRTTCRAVTHIDVSRAQAEEAGAAVCALADRLVKA